MPERVRADALWRAPQCARLQSDTVGFSREQSGLVCLQQGCTDNVGGHKSTMLAVPISGHRGDAPKHPPLSKVSGCGAITQCRQEKTLHDATSSSIGIATNVFPDLLEHLQLAAAQLKVQHVAYANGPPLYGAGLEEDGMCLSIQNVEKPFLFLHFFGHLNFPL